MNIRRSFLLLLAFLPLFVNGQTLTGMSGLLNIPSADMQADGTFILGANYLPRINQPADFYYNTENYFFNLTFLPFLEIAYKLTLIRTPQKINQDRSASFRLQLIKEKSYLPSITVGVHDFHTTSDGGNQFFEANYIVLTKHFKIQENDIGITAGYGTNIIMKNSRFIGFFGGMSVTPGFCKPLKFMGEYDCNGVNLGGSLLLFKHLYLFSMAQHLQYFAGGMAYRIYL